MTKISTLETVLSSTRSDRNLQRNTRLLPAYESVTLLIQYSMALEVIRTQASGNIFLILN